MARLDSFFTIGVNRKIFHIAVHCRNEFLKHGDKKNADIFSSILKEFFDDREEKQLIYNQIVNRKRLNHRTSSSSCCVVTP